MAERFVILLHVGHGEDHYDLMLTDGDGLATWQMTTDPAGLSVGQSAPATKLADHRSEYLTYEGLVSGGRGRVSRVAEGRYDVISRREECLACRLMGPAIEGRFELRRIASGDQWRITHQGD